MSARRRGRCIDEVYMTIIILCRLGREKGEGRSSEEEKGSNRSRGKLVKKSSELSWGLGESL